MPSCQDIISLADSLTLEDASNPHIDCSHGPISKTPPLTFTSSYRCTMHAVILYPVQPERFFLCIFFWCC
ncbi:Uncharacterized protein HZ326_23996 [Fusarium oxysporum f. sp. albedinis]|nr:Uncharacterized protein HZ326_23996 [Fusarium oxysporum f. sp. albedinis]